MATIETEAIILGGSDYSESSRLLSLLTPDEGHVRLIAKGVRSGKSRHRGSVEPMSRVEVRFSLREPDALGTLMDSRVINAAEYLRADLTKYALAAVACELIERGTLSGAAAGGLYALLRGYLDELRQSSRAPELTIRLLAQLLEQFGFSPSLSECASCGKQAAVTAFSVSLGGIICADCQPRLGGLTPFDTGAARTLLTLANRQQAAAQRVALSVLQARRLLTVLLDVAEHHLELRLNSRRFLAQLWSEANPQHSVTKS